MAYDSSRSGGSVGDVLSKIGRAVSEGAMGDGPPELLLTEDMRVWDSVPMAAERLAPPPAPAIDEARIREIVAETVLQQIASNPEIGALIRQAAQPAPEAVNGAVRAAVGSALDTALDGRMAAIRREVSGVVENEMAEAMERLSAVEDMRKKQARKAVRAELKAMLAALDES